MWISKSGQALPPFAPKVLEYLDFALHHPHQMSLAQFCAYHLRDVIYNLDMITIARTTKLAEASKEKVENESTEPNHGQATGVETEFYGGEHGQEPEDENLQEPRHGKLRWFSIVTHWWTFSPDALKSLLLPGKVGKVQP